MIASDGTVGLADRIIDDTYFEILFLNFFQPPNHAVVASFLLITSQFTSILAKPKPVNPYYQYYNQHVAQARDDGGGHGHGGGGGGHGDHGGTGGGHGDHGGTGGGHGHTGGGGGYGDYSDYDHNYIDSSYIGADEVGVAAGGGASLLAALGLAWLGFKVADELVSWLLTHMADPQSYLRVCPSTCLKI